MVKVVIFISFSFSRVRGKCTECGWWFSSVALFLLILHSLLRLSDVRVSLFEDIHSRLEKVRRMGNKGKGGQINEE